MSLRERTQLVRDHTRRVLNRRKPGGRSAPVTAPVEEDAENAEPEKVAAATTVKAATTPPANKPAPGAKPSRPTSKPSRPAGKRTPRGR